MTAKSGSKNGKGLFVGLLAFLLLGGGIATYLMNRPEKDVSTNLQEIKIAQFGDFFLYAPLYIAIDQGFFKDEGLDVSLINTGGDEKTWATVISGNAAFGLADPTFIAVSDSRGKPGRVIANIVDGVPFWGVTLDPNIKIEKPQDLAGYSVATFPAPSTAYTLQKDMFEDGELEPKISQGAPGTLLAQLRAKQVDIALELEPNASQAVADGGHIGLFTGKSIWRVCDYGSCNNSTITE